MSHIVYGRFQCSTLYWPRSISSEYECIPMASGITVKRLETESDTASADNNIVTDRKIEQEFLNKSKTVFSICGNIAMSARCWFYKTGEIIPGNFNIGEMKTLELDKTKCSFLLSSNHITIHVYENETKKANIRASGYIKDYSVTSDTLDDWTLYCLTSDGQLFRVSRQQIVSQQQKSLSEEDDIFQDLLTTNDLELSVATERVYVLTSADLVHNFGQVYITSICLYGNNLLTVCHHEGYYELNLHSIHLHSGHYTLTLRRKFVLNCPNSNVPQSSKVFYMVAESENLHVESSDYLRISMNLFKSLLGSELALMNSAIILFCPPFGSVFYAPVKSKYEEMTETLFHKLTLFCQTSKQVLGIDKIWFPTRWEEENRNEENTEKEIRNQDGLFLVTNDGKCVLISSWSNNGAQFVPITIPGPVECFSIYTNTLYHSNSRDLIESEICAECDNKTGTVTARIVNQQSLGICNVQQVVTVQDQSLVEGTPCLLFYQTKSGQCCVVSPGKIEKDKQHPGGDNPGQQIKDVLVNLEKCHIEKEKLTALGKAHHTFISQLSVANFLICMEGNNQLFKHKFTLRYLPHSLEFELNYELTNCGNVYFSSDWNLVMSVKHIESSLTKSVLFNLHKGLKLNECIAISTVLSDQNVYLPYKVQIQLQLEIPKDIINNTDCAVILPVFLTSKIVDIIYFIGDEKHQKKFMNEPVLDHKNGVRDLALSRPIAKCLQNADNSGEIVHDPVTLLIHKPLDILNQREISRVGKDEPAILRYLLEDSDQISDISDKALTLSVCGGSKVHVDVSIEDQIVISLQSTDLPLCTAIRLAILDRLQGLDKNTEKNFTMTSIQTKLKLHQELLTELQQLEEDNVNTGSSDVCRRTIVDIYTKLRQIHTFI
ncbi:uncharacterized protein LOC134688174 [Mytilus trossulus]|uniref:uncharacterized protein LOC134688174 n=1 Tax=Mytilus trossulus TaxID=6551 RepID=UPI0030068194